MNHIQKSSFVQETASGAAGCSITVAAPGAGKYVCLTSLDAESDNAGGANVTVTSGTTKWQHGITQNESVFKKWSPGNPLRGAENTAVVVAVSAGGATLNISGFVTP